MLNHYIDQEKKIIEITISGQVTLDDLTTVIREIEPPIMEWPDIRLLKRIDSFSGIEWRALVDDFKFAFDNFLNFKKIKKVAIVTDKDWVENLSSWLSPFFPGEVQVFESEDVEEARAWLT